MVINGNRANAADSTASNRPGSSLPAPSHTELAMPTYVPSSDEGDLHKEQYNPTDRRRKRRPRGRKVWGSRRAAGYRRWSGKTRTRRRLRLRMSNTRRTSCQAMRVTGFSRSHPSIDSPPCSPQTDSGKSSTTCRRSVRSSNRGDAATYRGRHDSGSPLGDEPEHHSHQEDRCHKQGDLDGAVRPLSLHLACSRIH